MVLFLFRSISIRRIEHYDLVSRQFNKICYSAHYYTREIVIPVRKHNKFSFASVSCNVYIFNHMNLHTIWIIEYMRFRLQNCYDFVDKLFNEFSYLSYFYKILTKLHHYISSLSLRFFFGCLCKFKFFYVN